MISQKMKKIFTDARVRGACVTLSFGTNIPWFAAHLKYLN